MFGGRRDYAVVHALTVISEWVDDRLLRLQNRRSQMPVPLVAMKKILTLGFLLLGLQQVSPQPLPSYDLSYYDSPQCIREKAISFGKSTLIPNKPDEAVGKSICQVAKTAARSSREDIAERWDTIPSEVRWKCIKTLENDRKTGRIPMIDYGKLGSCMNDLMQK
jgi:hypothetical protein